MEPGDTFAALAKRYNSVTALVASANHDTLPEAGSWAAIPIAYPGERPVVRASKSAPKYPVARRTHPGTSTKPPVASAKPLTSAKPTSAVKPASNGKKTNAKAPPKPV